MDKIDEVLTRGVEKIYPSKEVLEKVLRSGKKLKLYQGFDPTSKEIHIGHMIGLRKLRQFQDLGHHVIFLIGDGTGQAGDPSGKLITRRNIHSLTFSTHEDKPGVLRKLAESFEKEGVSIEAIKSQREQGEVKFKITVDEKKYSPELITKVVRTLGHQGFFTHQELRENAITYIHQVSRILKTGGYNPVEILYNGDWLNKLTYEDILNIAGHFSLQQLSERDLFQERMKRGLEVNLREFLYPVFQAYDSVVLNVDLEIGGSDQTFNMLEGRDLVKDMLGKEKFVLTTPLLADPSGVKIGKTTGNVISLANTPEKLYGQIMNFPDSVIISGLEYLTDTPAEEIKKIESEIKKGANPMQFKKRLAFEVVKQLNSEVAAQKAQEEFEQVFQKGGVSVSIPTIKVKNASVELVDFLVENNLAPSKSEAKRLIRERAIELGGQIAEESEIELENNQVMRIGKRKFVKIIIE